MPRIVLDVGKLRYGQKPEPLELWFDATTFRLTPLPPIVASLELGAKTRTDLLADCFRRFGLRTRKADELIGEVKAYLNERPKGHQKVFEIDWDRVTSALQEEENPPPSWVQYLQRDDLGEMIGKAA